MLSHLLLRRPACRRVLLPRATPHIAAFSTQVHPPGANLGPHHAHSRPFPIRTHNCGALQVTDVDSRVVLAGWIQPQRKISNSLSFFSIKDSYGTTQLVASSHTKEDAALLDALSTIPVESVVLIEGHVRARPKTAQRKSYPTGEIEVQISNFTLLNPADHSHMPFLPSDGQNLANDELRARYRHLDLRRQTLTNNLRKRSQVAHVARSVFHDQDFVEVETPLLLKSTPEGAREFLVPTRIAKVSKSGHQTPEPLFYALPQSPQQPKQMLMCSGAIDKYFQFARCFRDEDGRKDRQPEFTQIDLEMAFVSWGNEPDQVVSHEGLASNDGAWAIGGREVRFVIEVLMRRIWSEVEGITLPSNPFPVMTYREAMNRNVIHCQYGSDKPDTRFGLEISDLTPFLPSNLRDGLSSSGDIVECFTIRHIDGQDFLSSSQACKHESTEIIEEIKLTSDNFLSWLCSSKIVRNIPSSLSLTDVCLPETLRINEHLQVEVGDIIWLARRRSEPEGDSTMLGRIRLRIPEIAEMQYAYRYTKDPRFLWVTEFPLFTRSDDNKEFLAKGRWSSTHHPFTAPMWQDVTKLYSGDITSVRGQHYDLVLNGTEIGGGSVRVHDANMQDYIFSEILQLTEIEKARFDHLLDALKCGAPPHGGIALGFDRLMAIICNAESIRDVIAFPKTGARTDTFFKSPSAVSADELAPYGIAAR